MSFEIAARAILGKRSSQQDAWRVIDGRGNDLAAKAENGSVTVGDGALVIVADGVGGYAGGEVASNLACKAFVSSFTNEQGPIDARLQTALGVANTAIGDEQRRQPDKRDMSTTFIGIYLDGDKMTFVSVGDSLLLRYRDEEIHRVNLDHSYSDVLDRRLLHVGSSDPREWSVVINDDQRAAITLALSGGPLDRAEYGHKPQIATRRLLPGDVIIAASDGIETIEMVQLQNFVRQLVPKGASGIAEGLIKAADGIGPNRRREPDNTTIVIIQVPDGAKSAAIAVTTASLAPTPAAAAAAAPAAAAAGTAAAATTTLGRVVPGGAKFSPLMAIGAGVALAVLISVLILFFIRPATQVSKQTDLAKKAETQVPGKQEKKGGQSADDATKKQKQPQQKTQQADSQKTPGRKPRPFCNEDEDPQKCGKSGPP